MSVTMRVIARSQRKRVVVFSHGLGYEHASMLPLMRKVSDLSHNGATLLAAELPSHGSNTSDVTLIEQPHTHPYADWGELTDALIASTRAVCAEQGVESGELAESFGTRVLIPESKNNHSGWCWTFHVWCSLAHGVAPRSGIVPIAGRAGANHASTAVHD
eukprot:TRINITY_DN1899_c0_g1_i2.p2 TRINITY_DN1899_c0_g1~~TRINITY_DN1899_c0_g1_i2.p2  ORF type:complete len:173 (+),score=13.49 TRINITY_DN1899_c0_g1_i2:41-520(+)